MVPFALTRPGSTKRAGVARCFWKVSGGPGSQCSGEQEGHCRKQQHRTSCAVERQQNLNSEPWRLPMRGWVRGKGPDFFCNGRPQTAAPQRKEKALHPRRRGPFWFITDLSSWDEVNHGIFIKGKEDPGVGQSFWCFGVQRLRRHCGTWGEADKASVQLCQLHLKWPRSMSAKTSLFSLPVMAFGISLIRVKSLKGLLRRWRRVGGTVRAETLVKYWNTEKDEFFVPMRFGDVRIGDFRCSCCARPGWVLTAVWIMSDFFHYRQKLLK